MLIKKGTKLKIRHRRKGTFVGMAERDFDTKDETFYPVVLAEGVVDGLAEDWTIGEQIPCRASLCEFAVID